MEVAIPKLRNGSYFPDWLLERRRRAERALAILPPACDRAEGQLASLSDAPAQASERFERAIAAYEQLGASFEAARTKELLAGIRG
jgi:hypothetical protein